jgi:hypothetical protein
MTDILDFEDYLEDTVSASGSISSTGIVGSSLSSSGRTSSKTFPFSFYLTGVQPRKRFTTYINADALKKITNSLVSLRKEYPASYITQDWYKEQAYRRATGQRNMAEELCMLRRIRGQQEPAPPPPSNMGKAPPLDNAFWKSPLGQDILKKPLELAKLKRIGVAAYVAELKKVAELKQLADAKKAAMYAAIAKAGEMQKEIDAGRKTSPAAIEIEPVPLPPTPVVIKDEAITCGCGDMFAIRQLLEKLTNQQLVTSEHNTINDTQRFRRNTLSNLGTILARLPGDNCSAIRAACGIKR